MTHRLAHHFKMSQMLQHSSIFNIVNLYNDTHISPCPPPSLTPTQSFSSALSAGVCKDGMDIHTLLYHFSARSHHFHKNHSCGRCTSITHCELSDEYPVIRAVVTDGLTIGHWRCSASRSQLENIVMEAGDPPPNGPCLNSLDNVRSQYCSTHFQLLHKQCEAQPCTRPVVKGTKTCSLDSHIKAAKDFYQDGNFQLHPMLNRPGSNLRLDPTVHQNEETAELQDYDDIQHANESDRYDKKGRDGGCSSNDSAPKLSRARTHNYQLIVGTCGVILARQTMYNSESPSAVKLFLMDTFPNNMPQVIFYDNACKLLAHIYKSDDSERGRFQESIVAVDAFHFKSHKEDDCFCRKWTDPNLYPQLKDQRGWIFNSSAAEGMTAVQYNFFLDEMVRLHNIWLCEKLEKQKDIGHLGDLHL
ncbi:hypothetical protein DFH28DRAFT_942729 [Melampsora americana]|nr:hypothetical protein DFH28DRAFT_942729 [Melampsora americana]